MYNVIVICSYLKLYDRRKKYVKKKDQEKWALLDYQYMTEESDHSDHIVQHPLPWRSESMSIPLIEVNELILFFSSVE